MGEEQPNFFMDRVDPPKSFKKIIREPGKLIFQLLFFTLMFIPLFIYSCIEYFIKKPKSIKNNVVVITGSGRGLGRGLALKFAELGCKIACVDIDTELNNETLKLINEKYPGRANSYKCNVGKFSDIQILKEAIIKDFGEVNILINNAGLVIGSSILDIDEEYAQAIVAINFTSHILMMKEFLPQMIERNEGHIVSISSCSALTGLSNACVYSGTKHGLLGLMESVDYELNERSHNKVRTTTVFPYFINTSPFYCQFWKIRFPELTIDETVEKIVDGILKNRRTITIPTHLYYILVFQRLLPDRITNMIRRIFYVRIISPPKTFQNSFFTS